MDGTELKEKDLVCKICGGSFIFSVGEQQFYQDRQLREPRRCPQCRRHQSPAWEGGEMGRDILIPDSLSSSQQYARFMHLDLPELEDSELRDELYALQPLIWGLPADHWLRSRVKELEGEIQKRRGNTSFRSSDQRRPKLAEGVEP